MSDELLGHRTRRHDGKAPLVEGDELGHELGAQSARITALPVDADRRLLAHRASSFRQQGQCYVVPFRAVCWGSGPGGGPNSAVMAAPPSSRLPSTSRPPE